MKLKDRGTTANPWIIFFDDILTGVSIENGRLIFVLDSHAVELADWLDGLQERGHIDRMTKYAIIAAVATGDGVFGKIMKRFSRG